LKNVQKIVQGLLFKIVTVQPSASCYRHQALQKPLRGWLDASRPLCSLTDFAAQCEVLGWTVTQDFWSPRQPWHSPPGCLCAKKEAV